MDRGKRPSNLIGSGALSTAIYMDFKDIIRERALPFLPAKSLSRFSAVCRDWRNLISSPFFAHNQSITFHTISGLFFQTLGDPPSFVSLSPDAYGIPDPSLKFLPVPVVIRASSNGLLCCRAEDQTYYICNPVTKQWKMLPRPNTNHGRDPAVALVFQPELLNFEADFKVVCAFQSTDFDGGYEFEIYSSKEASWKLSGEICYGESKFLPSQGVYVDGSVYWQRIDGVIVAYDLTRDRSNLIRAYCRKWCLGEANGKLCMASIEHRTLTVSMLSNIYSNTMQMSSNARMWEEKIHKTLGTSALKNAAPGHLEVLFSSGDTVLLRLGSRLFSYDVKDDETTELEGEPRSDARIIPYVNSFAYI